MKAILPVAGNGTRMYPLGLSTPKCLITILNKPLLLWSIEALVENGVDEVILVISAGKFGQLIREYAEKLTVPGCKISFAIQEQQLGTAHVVQMAKDFFKDGEEFIFLYGDDLYSPKNVAEIVKQPGLAVMGMKVKDPEKWGIFQADASGKLVGVVEKPAEFVGDLANIGCMKLNTRVFELYDKLKVSPRGEYELTDQLQMLAEEGTVAVIPTVDYWIPIGYPWHILEATEHFLPQIESKIDGTVEENVVIKGKVILPKSSVIKAGTYIEGNVVIGENCQIGPNAHLRSNVVVGDGSKVGFAVEVKNSVIGSNTFLSHLIYIGDSIIGNNVNIAAGTMIANLRHDHKNIQTPIKGKMTDTLRIKFGTVVGDGVKLGINTSIYQGRKIWPGLTTRPGQVVDRDLTE